MSDYILWIEEQQRGPLTAAEVRELIRSGQVTAQTMGRRPNESDWRPLSAWPVLWKEPPAAMGHESAVAAYETSLKQRELDRLFRAAGRVEWASYFLFMAAAGAVLVAVMAGEGGGNWQIWAAGAGGALALGLWVNLIAQLLHIRAALAQSGKES